MEPLPALRNSALEAPPLRSWTSPATAGLKSRKTLSLSFRQVIHTFRCGSENLAAPAGESTASRNFLRSFQNSAAAEAGTFRCGTENIQSSKRESTVSEKKMRNEGKWDAEGSWDV